MEDGDMEEMARAVFHICCLSKGFIDGNFALCGWKCIKYSDL